MQTNKHGIQGIRRGSTVSRISMVTSKCSQMIHATERNRERMVEVVKNMDNLWLFEYRAESRHDALCIHRAFIANIDLLSIHWSSQDLVTCYERPK